MSAVGARPCVFLDRDGTLHEDLHFLRRPEDVHLFPGVGPALAELRAAGYALVLVTNQSGVARGLLDESDLARVHARLEELLAREGARLDAIHYSPYHPTEGRDPWRRESDCRKPGPGMLLRAADELGLDLGASWIVGDSARDLEAGRRAGTRAVLVATGKGEREHERLAADGVAHVFVPDLTAAARRILEEDGSAPPAGARPT